MNFSLEKVEKLSGREASVYAVVLEGESHSVFEGFLAEYQTNYRSEILDIIARLKVIGHRTGARKDFFKEFEGEIGDLVCALYDDPDKKLRLYCMRFGGDFVILGGGGPKEVRAWQDDPNLKYHAETMIAIAKKVHGRFKDGDLCWTTDYKDIKGDLTFKEDEDE
jgi:hypothetical protein